MKGEVRFTDGSYCMAVPQPHKRENVYHIKLVNIKSRD